MKRLNTHLADFRFQFRLPRNATDVVWLGASSFEPRCTGSLARLVHTNVRVSAALRCDYGSRTSVPEEADALRLTNKRILAKHLLDLSCKDITVCPVGTLSTSAFVSRVRDFLEEGRGKANHAIIDISCFTRLHVVALGALVAEYNDSESLWIAYTIPENYATMAEHNQNFEGYGKVVIAPIVDGALLRFESRARGVILLSHEAQRLVVALAELEAAGGVIIQPITPERPDFSYASRRRNHRALGRLSEIGQWVAPRVVFTEILRLARIIDKEIARAKADLGPLILYPLGPKSFVFASAVRAAERYPEASWFVYPTPSYYNPFATQGIGPTNWMPISRYERNCTSR